MPLPTRCWISPNAWYLSSMSPTMNINGSYNATSTSSPSPVCSRRNSDMAVPMAAAMPAIESAKPNGGDVGGLSGQPLMNAKPLATSATVPNPGRAEYGPVCPKPDTRVRISRGLTARRSS